MKENTLELSFEMYEELKETLIKTLRTELAEARSQPAAPVDTDAIKQLLQTISERQEQPPRMVQHRFSFSLDATRNFWLFMSMFVVIIVLSVGLYLEWRPDRSRYDNDLKYRYVLMKGEASPKRLSELEELFEVERDQRRIDSMRMDVEKYERLVRRRAALDEQARLKSQEAERLKRDAARLKNK